MHTVYNNTHNTRKIESKHSEMGLVGVPNYMYSDAGKCPEEQDKTCFSECQTHKIVGHVWN